MANKKIQATATLFLNTADAKKDAEKFVNDIKQKLKSIETAADKVDVFKDLVGYISQVDKALSALKAKNADTFNSMFDGIDTNLLKEIEKIFGTTKDQLAQLDQLRTKILNAKTNGATTDELKALEQQIKDLYAAAGKMDDLKLSGRGSLETRIGKMESALNDFAAAWDSVNSKISQGFGSGSGGIIDGLSKEVQAEINRLEESLKQFDNFKQQLKNVSKSSIDFELNNDSIKKFLYDYEQLSDAIENFDGNIFSDDYQEQVRKYVKMSSQLLKLKDEFKKVSKNASISQRYENYDDLSLIAEDVLASVNEGSLVEAENNINKVRNLIADLKKVGSLKITLDTESISEAISELQRLNAILDDDIDDFSYDVISFEIETLNNKILELAKNSQHFDDIQKMLNGFDRFDTDSEFKTFLTDLCDLLGVKVPDATNDAKKAIDNIASSGSNNNITILAKQLQEIFDTSRQIGDHELGFAIDSSGVAYFIESSEAMVKAADEATVAVMSLNENMTMLGHTHPRGGGLFSVNDVLSAINQKRSGINSPTMLIGETVSSILNLDGVAESVLKEVEIYLGKFASDSIVSQKMVKDIQGIFDNNGLLNNFQIIDTSEGMDQLAVAIKNMSENVKDAQSPLEKLQSLISYYSNNKLDNSNLADFNEYWNEFISGAKNASEIFDAVMTKLGAKDPDGNVFNTSEKSYQNLSAFLKAIVADTDAAAPKIDQAKTAIKEFLALADEIQNKNFSLYGSDGNVEIGKYIERLDVAKAALDALGDQGVLTAEQLEEVQRAFNQSRSHLSAYTTSYTGYGDGYYWHSYEDEKNALEEENKKLHEQINQQSVSEDEIETLRKENGLLEEKLEILQDIADAYGIHITQKARNRYDELVDKEMDSGLSTKEEDRMSELSDTISEADEHLMEFENTYDRIILKLSNGKKIEILPDDNGLRKLDRISNEYYSGEYNGFEIDDVIFVRKQEQAIIENNNSALEEQLRLQKQISSETKNDSEIYETKDGQLALFDEIATSAQRAEGKVEELEDSIEKVYNLDGQTSMFDASSESYEKASKGVSGEFTRLEALREKLLEVKAAVDAKTRAFEEEYVTVDGAVEAEIVSLQELSNKLDGIVAKVGLVESSLRNIGSSSVQLNVSDSEEQLASLLTSSDITKEMGELEKLQKQVIAVKNAVLSKTKAFVDEGNVVGEVVGKEISALMKLEGIVNNISKKISELVQNITTLNSRGINFNQNGDVDEANTRTPEEQLKLDKTAQKGALTKYIESLKEVDYVAEDLRETLINLYDSIDGISTTAGLDEFKKKLTAAKKEIDTAKSRFVDRYRNDVSGTRNSLQSDWNKLSVNQREDLEPYYDEAIAKLQEYKEQIEAGKKVEIKSIEDAVAGIREKIKAQIELNNAAKNAEKTQKKNATFGDTAMINAKAKYNALDEAVHSKQFANSSAVMAAWDEYVAKYQKLEEVQDKLSKKPSITSDDEVAFKAAKDACNDYAKVLNKMLNDSIKLHSKKANETDYMLGSDFNYDDENSRKEALADFAKTQYDVVLSTENFKKGFREAMFEVKNGDGTITKMTASFTEARNEIVATAGDVKKVQGAFSNFIDGIKARIKSLSQFFIATISIYDVWRVVKTGIGYVRDIDSALTELKKVTNETDASYNKFLQDMAKTGSVVGATVKDLTSMAADWSKLGYSMEEAGKLAKSTAVLLNVSEFQDANSASEALISTMQAFGYAADESMHVVDVLNEVGKFVAYR